MPWDDEDRNVGSLAREDCEHLRGDVGTLFWRGFT
jgi:hypothetical protein